MKRKRRAAAPLRRGPAVLLGDGCLLLLVLAGTAFSFLTAFSVQIHALPLLLGCAAAALAFLGLWSLPRRWWALPLALLAAAWLLAVRRLWQPLALGADALRVDVVNTVSASLELGFTLEPALSLPEALWTNCATLLVLLALVPLGALLGLGVVRLRSFWLVFVSSFPFVLLPLCISVTPGWLPLMALVLGWVVPALTSLLARTSPLGAARLNLAALPAAALLLAALSLAMPMDTYQRPAWADRALQHLTNQAVRLGDGLLEGSGPFGIGSGGGRLADADGSVSLSDAGPLRFSGRTVLEVETDLTGRIYLRGLSDAVYDGESWQPLDEAAYNWQARLRGVTYGAPVTLDMDLGVTGAESLFAQFQPMNFPALAVRDAHPESPYARITVRNVGADPGYVYVPYHILTQPGELSGAEFVHDAYLARPEQFTNVTNGIDHRRWLSQINPKLDALIRECTGSDAYLLHPESISGLEKYKDDSAVLDRLESIKQENKRRFAGYVARESGIILNTDAIFDVQVKRLHEYKRQLLNVLHIVCLYQQLRDDPNMDFTPQTFLFGAKAAPGYHVAKQIIQLINSLAAQINADPVCKDKLQVVFLENYRVSLAEKLMPASELSEQISTAGKEASGTGNMKFMMNGALTIGTLDGANVEMHQQLGDENIFLFGLTADQVEERRRQGYRSLDYYQQDPVLKRVLDQISAGFSDGRAYTDLTNRLLFGGGGGIADEYMLLADFDSYCQAHRRSLEVYKDRRAWDQKSLINIARSGIFAADRSIRDYARDIWHVPTRFD